jgi:hypothetical protein
MSELEESLASQIKAINLPVPEREYRFQGISGKRKWRFDFAWLCPGIAMEVEGGVWSGGRHTTAQGFTKDAEKYNEAAICDWLVLRVTGDMVKDGSALGYLEQAFKARGETLRLLGVPELWSEEAGSS